MSNYGAKIKEPGWVGFLKKKTGFFPALSRTEQKYTMIIEIDNIQLVKVVITLYIQLFLYNQELGHLKIKFTEKIEVLILTMNMRIRVSTFALIPRMKRTCMVYLTDMMEVQPLISYLK